MEYQININYQFTADSESEANEKAKNYVSENLQTCCPQISGKPRENHHY
jgi:hypothetical protein